MAIFEDTLDERLSVHGDSIQELGMHAIDTAVKFANATVKDTQRGAQQAAVMLYEHQELCTRQTTSMINYMQRALFGKFAELPNERALNDMIVLTLRSARNEIIESVIRQSEKVEGLCKSVPNFCQTIEKLISEIRETSIKEELERLASELTIFTTTFKPVVDHMQSAHMGGPLTGQSPWSLTAIVDILPKNQKVITSPLTMMFQMLSIILRIKTSLRMVNLMEMRLELVLITQTTR